jgi:tetratricopeptide (TPR) repeat protein
MHLHRVAKGDVDGEQAQRPCQSRWPCHRHADRLPEHPDTVVSLNNLGALYYATGAYAKAEPLFKRALAIYENALGPEHPDTVVSLNNLGALYYATGAYAKAEPLFKRALAIYENALGRASRHRPLTQQSRRAVPRHRCLL